MWISLLLFFSLLIEELWSSMEMFLMGMVVLIAILLFPSEYRLRNLAKKMFTGLSEGEIIEKIGFFIQILVKRSKIPIFF